MLLAAGVSPQLLGVAGLIVALLMVAAQLQLFGIKDLLRQIRDQGKR